MRKEEGVVARWIAAGGRIVMSIARRAGLVMRGGRLIWRYVGLGVFLGREGGGARWSAGGVSPRFVARVVIWRTFWSADNFFVKE